MFTNLQFIFIKDFNQINREQFRESLQEGVHLLLDPVHEPPLDDEAAGGKGQQLTSPHPAFIPSRTAAAAAHRRGGAGPEAGQGEGGAAAAAPWMLSRTGACVEPRVSLRI